MSERMKEGDVAGTSFRVGDPYIWAEIYYLDSPTDYREYLPPSNPVAPAARGQLVLLDSSDPSLSKTFGILLLTLAVVFLTVGYFLHAILDIL